MSYLAMSAAPINNENNQSFQNDTPINKKRQHNNNNNRTQKYRQPLSDLNSQKVNSVLQSIHNNTLDDDELGLGNYNSKDSKQTDDFAPLNPYDFPNNPISMGAEKKATEGMSNMSNMVPQPTDNEELKLQELQSAFMNDAQVREYYRKLVPNYNNSSHKNEHNKNYHNIDQQSNHNHNYQLSSNSNEILIDKLNYMINLLEEQQDQKTSNVTEEVVLYSFLGIFIIFIVDSFRKVGKYTR